MSEWYEWTEGGSVEWPIAPHSYRPPEKTGVNRLTM